jgi:hypothetical protein
MAGEDLLEGTDGGANDTRGKKGKKKPLSKGQKIGVVIGGITILLVLVQIERSKASAGTSATTATAPIDPTTGDPSGSAADQAALAAMQSAAGSSGGGGGYYDSGSSDSGTDPATGASYSSEISANATAWSALGPEITALEAQVSSLSSNPGPPGPPGPAGPPAPASHGATSLQSANLANLEAELKRDQTGKATPNKTKAIATLNKQITAVKGRS